MTTRPTGSGSRSKRTGGDRDRGDLEPAAPGGEDATAGTTGGGPATVPPPQPWERQAGESAPAFGAATCYFELGPDRNLRTVARSCFRNLSMIGRWSSRWGWVERALAYDDHMARTWQAEKERALARRSREWAERRETLRDREWQIAVSLLDLAEKVLAQDLKYRGSYTARDAAALLDKGSELGRRAAGIAPRATPARRARSGSGVRGTGP